MRLDLYIDGQRADLSIGGSEALILWTYSREDAEAPAAVKNSFTKTVTLPATDANDTIFSHLYRVDHNTGIQGVFDPLARTPFSIYSEAGTVLESGYLKVDNVLRRGPAPVAYEVTLYGGMGDLFYNLMYKADGSKRTLGDMRWLTDISQQPDERNLEDPHEIHAWCPWQNMYDGTYLSREDGCLVAVPVNGGIPDKDFDASKAYYKPGTYFSDRLDGIKTSVTEDGTTYGPHPDAGGGVIINLGNRVTDWEAQCLAPSNMKPAIHLARVLLSIEEASRAGDFGDWRLWLYGSWFLQKNPYWWYVWMTLPYADNNNQSLDTCLTNSMSPAELLLGYAKMFGLVFHPDPATKTIYLMTREEYYANGAQDIEGLEEKTIDLSDRVSGDEVPTRPYIMDARVYDFSVPTAGAFAKYYADKYGRDYGSFRLDTLYSFDAAVSDIMRSLPFNGCADVQEDSAWYFAVGDTVSTAPPLGNYIKFMRYGEVTYLLYNSTGNKSIKMTVQPYGGAGYRYSLPALPQFHDENGKPTESGNVLLFYLGAYTLPSGETVNPVRWHTGAWKDGSASKLTGGKTVYNISPTVGVNQITQIPWFRRVWDQQPSADAQWTHSLDFGAPNEVATGDHHGAPAADAFVFKRRWEAYLSDRFDRDTVAMTVRVDLSGLQVDASLLRRFYWYHGAVWSLNKIIDYNPARPCRTECEFVRVHDLSAYTGITA